jgi:hypothetical protein
VQYFDTIVPGEKNVLTFNLSAGLTNGNLLQGTPTVDVIVYSGTDADPSGILNGSPQIDTTKTLILVPVAPGVDQVIYQITAFCGTANPDILLGLPARLPVNSSPT